MKQQKDGKYYTTSSFIISTLPNIARMIKSNRIR